MALNTTAGPAFTTVAVQETGEEDDIAVQGGDNALQKYYRESAARCFLNQTCNCCTCRCCALSIAICWIIFGAFGAFSASAMAGNLELINSCPANSIYAYEQCCEYDAGNGYYVYYEADMCDKLKTACTIDLVNGILRCVAGIAGVLGLVKFISWLLLVPMGYSAVAVIISIVGVILVFGGEATFYAAPIFGIAIAVALGLLFWNNYKLIKDIVGD